MPDNVDLLEKTVAFQGYFRVERYRLRYRRFDGSWSKPMDREVFERGSAVAVLLYDPVHDAVGLIEQFRPGALAAGWDPWLIELVAGIIDEENLEDVAVREVKEETGAEVSNLEEITRYLVTPGGSSEAMFIFCGRVNIETLSGFHGLAEEGEDIRVFSMPATEAIAWVSNGKIANSTAIIGLQWLALNRDSLRKKWLECKSDGLDHAASCS